MLAGEWRCAAEIQVADNVGDIEYIYCGITVGISRFAIAGVFLMTYYNRVFDNSEIPLDREIGNPPCVR